MATLSKGKDASLRGNKAMKTIPSQLYLDEAETLVTLCQSIKAKNVAEIGCALGGTTVMLASAGNVWAIDKWEDENTYYEFLQKLAPLIQAKLIVPLRLSSHLAATLFEDGFFDLVFIDADHSYSAVSQDIRLWYPKIRSGGILCGHDCEQYYHAYNLTDQALINLHAEDDQTPFTCHAGVVKALFDIFHDDYERQGNNRVWVKRKL